MAYDERLAYRIAEVLLDAGVRFSEKKMFGGICFMVDDKMCCGTHVDKVTGENLLLCRIGEKETTKALEMPDCLPMDFSGKPMKDYIYVRETGLKTTQGLGYWLGLSLQFNRVAQKSRK